MGHITTMEYGGTGVLVRQVLPDGREWRFEYDGIERLREIKNPKCETYEFRYDRAGRVIQEKTFDNRRINYTYSRANNLHRIEYPDDTWRDFQYDPLGNVTRENSPHGTLKYTRDNVGRLLEAAVMETSGKTVVQFERDPFGRVVAEIQNGQRIEFEHDAHGRRTLRRLPGGETTRYAYDRTGAIARLEHDGHALTFQRDALGREVRRQAGREQFDVFSAYDAMGRLTDRWAARPERQGEGAQTILSQRRWSYDPSGRVIGIQDARWGTTRYAYNEIGELLEAHRGTLHELFHYDGAGSLKGIHERFSDRNLYWEVGEGNLLLQTPEADFEYDKNGRRKRTIHRKDNRATGEVTEYFWDCRDRLREVRLPSGERALYTYDAFGRRVRKEIVPPEPPPEKITAEPERVRVVHFLWDGNALAQEVDTERGKRVFVHEPGTIVPLLQQEQGEVFTYVNDHLGTPRELLDQAGVVVWAGTHSAWGVIGESWSPERGKHVETPFRLLGQYHDDETELCCTRYRYFDPRVGRWLSADPLGVAGGPNVFAFAGSPTVDTDPLGLCATGKPKTYITYVFVDSNGQVVYVGRGSGKGTPEQVLQQRLAKGHHVFDEHPGLTPRVRDVQSTREANLGAEEMWYRYYRSQGNPLLNDPATPPLSALPHKIPKTEARLQAYIEDDLAKTEYY
jgi:RHS repeat-associated protein